MEIILFILLIGLSIFGGTIDKKLKKAANDGLPPDDYNPIPDSDFDPSVSPDPLQEIIQKSLQEPEQGLVQEPEQGLVQETVQRPIQEPVRVPDSSFKPAIAFPEENVSKKDKKKLEIDAKKMVIYSEIMNRKF